MITFAPAVYAHQRRKDGTYNVKVRVTFRGVHRHLPTTLTAYPHQLTRTLRIKDNNLLAQVNDLVARMREAVAGLTPFDLEGRDVDWVVGRIRARLGRQSFRLDFFAWGEGIAATKRPSTAKAYRVALRQFAAFLGTGSIDINDIRKSTAQGFADARATNAHYLPLLGALFELARSRYNTDDEVLIPREPFRGLDARKAPAQGQRNLGREMMQDIIGARTDDALQRMALDVFVASFALMGMNVADMLEAEVRGGRIIYERRKTRDRRADRARMEIDLPECVLPFLRRLGFTGEGLIAPRLAGYRRPLECVNGALHRWQEAEGVERFSTYAARHSWASIARSAGVEKATVDECLAHVGDFRIADIYAERDWRLINAANAKVLGLFSWG